MAMAKSFQLDYQMELYRKYYSHITHSKTTFSEYLDLLRNEVEEFRVLFAEWVKTFDQWNYIIDRWGLFNPPGINYDDYDPDDDIPFQNPFDNLR